MCTIVFAYGVYDGFAVASNRDEEYGRGFTPPETRARDTGGWYIAPHDERKGGTWLGVNSDGVAVTLSNLPIYADDTRSRGRLVHDILGASTVADARRRLTSSYDDHTYAGFNLVVGSATDCFIAVNDGELRTVEPDEGIGVVTNSPFDQPDDKARRVSEAVPSPDAHDAHGWLDTTRPVLASHELGVCVHDEDRGTTSSSLVYTLSETPGDTVFRFADGAPCEVGYETYTPPKEF